jgi:HK97 family phage portal protein
VGIFLGQTEKRQWAPEPIVPPFAGADLFGTASVKSRPDLAMTVPTVWACTNLLANAVSMLPLETYRASSDGIPARIPPSASSLISSPASGMTQSEWLHVLMVSLLLRGNFYGRISAWTADRARPTAIEPMSPDALDVRQADDGTITYKVKATQKLIPASDVFHVRGLTMPGSKIGMSPIQYAAATIGTDIFSRQFANDFFDGGGIPKALLKSAAPLDQTQATQVKARLMAAFRAREPVLIPAGIDYVPIAVHPEESQFLATQQANATQIARFFGIPAHMIDAPSGGSMTYANMEQKSLDFLTFSLSPWLKRIEDAFFPLLPGQQFVKFRTEDLLRTDAHTRAQVDMFEIASKVRTPTEIRADHGWPPMTEAQKAEANMVPLGIGPLSRPTATPALKENPGPVAPVSIGDQQGDGSTGG